MQRTVTIPLELNDVDKKSVIDTIEKYSKVYDEYAAWFTQNRTTSKVLGHRALYYSHNECGLPTALIQSARDNASESIKSYNSRFKKKAWSKTPKYRAKSMRYNLRSMSLRGDLLTFSSVNKRIRTMITVPDFFKVKYPERKIQAARIGINKNGDYYACLTFTVQGIAKNTSGKVVGLDRGIRNIVYTSEGVKYGGNKVRANRRKNLYLRGELQKKGTRSAKRKLKALSGREKRYSTQVNHEISKKLAFASGVQFYVLENLSGLGKKPKTKWKKHSNKRLSDWAHAQLLAFLIYKCEETGVSVVLVDPKYTSQDCSRCKGRPQGARSGGRYSCSLCGFQEHSDLNAALNIRDRGLEKLSSN